MNLKNLYIKKKIYVLVYIIKLEWLWGGGGGHGVYLFLSIKFVVVTHGCIPYWTKMFTNYVKCQTNSYVLPDDYF